jgi:hypothetical protein
MNHVKESLHSRLFSLGVLVGAVGAMVAGSWICAILLMAGLAAHEAAKHWASPQDPGLADHRGTSARAQM